MSDNRRVYRTIRERLQQLFPGEPRGNVARHLTTLAALVCNECSIRFLRFRNGSTAS